MMKQKNRRIVRIGKKMYSYEDMGRDIRRLGKRYRAYLGVRVLGKTPDQRNIYGIRLGNPRAARCMVVNASLHGREWLNTQLMMLALEHCCREMKRRSRCGKEYGRLLGDVCIYLLPMMNPDGVAVSQQGTSAIRNPELRSTVARLAGGESRRWKANARGVDLNRNFDCGFQRNPVKEPAAMEYGGERPFSEPETKVLAQLVKSVKPAGVINYHEAGPLIYYTRPSGLLAAIQKMTKYPLERERGGCPGSFGDWLTEQGIVYCTVETCRGKAPVRHWQIYPCYLKNSRVLSVAAKAAKDM